MSTRRQIFKLWKLPSNARLLPRKNLKSRTGPSMRAGTAGPRQPVGAGEGGCTHLVASFRELGRTSAGLRDHERAGTPALGSGTLQAAQAAQLGQDLLHADLAAQSGIIDTAGRLLRSRGRCRAGTGLGRGRRGRYCGGCRGNH